MRNSSVPRLWPIFWGAVIIALNMGCSGLSTGSDVLVYQGKIITGSFPVDTTINIFGDNRGRPILKNGKPRDGWVPNHPDTTGVFRISGTTPEYGDLESPPPHWEGGPLEIFVTHPSFQNYHDTLTKEELKALTQITPEQAGIKLDKIERGVWVLPDIVLQPK
jgi:hypothetical protein